MVAVTVTVMVISGPFMAMMPVPAVMVMVISGHSNGHGDGHGHDYGHSLVMVTSEVREIPYLCFQVVLQEVLLNKTTCHLYE